MQEEVVKELENTDRDYTAEQNQRVLPVVKEVLGAMGTFPFDFARDTSPGSDEKERASLAEFIRTEYMTRVLSQKLKQTDVSYTFKLMGMVVEMLRGRAMTPENETDPRLSSAAQQILTELGNQETLRIDFHSDRLDPEASGVARADLYTELYKTVVLKAFADHAIQVNEVNHVFDIMAMLVKSIESKSTETIINARKIAEAKMWGVEDIDDITVLDIHQKAIVPKESGVY